MFPLVTNNKQLPPPPPPPNINQSILYIIADKTYQLCNSRMIQYSGAINACDFQLCEKKRAWNMRYSALPSPGF